MFYKRNGGLFAVAIAIVISCMVANKARSETFEGMDVKTDGKGAAIIFIPGLNSASDVFKDTCDTFKKDHACYRLQLPGFAGQPALSSTPNGFLIAMRDSVERYIRSQQLGKVVLVGHSLGGTLSLMIALDAPELVNKVVIVDALPFYPAIQNQAVTADMMKPQAEGMRAAMLAQPMDEYARNAAASVQGMTNDPARIPLLVKWGASSDRNTTATAMYELMTTDLRDSISAIKTPTLVLGAWAAYKAYGSTKESTQAIYTAQYAQLKNVDIRMSDTSYHFISLDDPQWLNEQINDFLKQQ